MSQYSKPLDSMINGDMAEAQKGFAVLEEVDQGTFNRFIEWLYKGFYTPAEFEYVEFFPGVDSRESSEEVRPMTIQEPPTEEDPAPVDFEEAPPEPQGISWGFGTTWEAIPEPAEASWGSGRTSIRSKANKKSKKKGAFLAEETFSSSREQLKKSFISRRVSVRQGSISIPPPRANESPNEIYSEVFLSHARLYVFAEKYVIESLRDLALEELQTTLAIYTLYDERTEDIVNLLEYVYKNTAQSHRGEENLRTLLTHYVGYEMDVLMKDEDFKNLMIQDHRGELLGDFLGMVAKRI